jgi:hypothetical protein
MDAKWMQKYGRAINLDQQTRGKKLVIGNIYSK